MIRNNYLFFILLAATLFSFLIYGNNIEFYILIILFIWLFASNRPSVQQTGGKSIDEGKPNLDVDVDFKLTKPSTDTTSKLIQGVVFTSNTGLDELDGDRSSKYANFETDKAWGGNPDSRYFTYLEATLPNYSHLTGILTGGYRGQNEWVTEYYLEWWDNYHEKWIKLDKIFKGNNNDSGVVYNQINLDTSKIRIYPINWVGYPSLKVGLMGEKIEFMQCQYYQIQVKEGAPERRDYYQDLYQKNCLKIDAKEYERLGLEMQDLKSELNTLRVSLFQEKEKNQVFNQNYCPRSQLIDLANRFKNYQKCVAPKQSSTNNRCMPQNTCNTCTAQNTFIPKNTRILQDKCIPQDKCRSQSTCTDRDIYMDQNTRTLQENLPNVATSAIKLRLC